MKISALLHNDHLYMSPTCTSLPPGGPPSSLEDNPSWGVMTSTWHRCMWAKRDYLEVAFYPTSTHLEGELFRHLRFGRRDSIPLDEQQRLGQPPEYRVAHAMKLYELEALLVEVQNILQDAVNILVSLEKTPFPGPSSEAYTRWSKDRADVQNRAFYARRKFLYHIAMISYHIAVISYSSGDKHRWYYLLLERGVSGAIADKLSSTMIADFRPNVPRAGVFVLPDQQTESWILHLRALIAANIPVYIAWGPLHSSPSILHVFKHLYPTKDEIAYLRSSQDLRLAWDGPPSSWTGGDRTSESGGHSDLVNQDSSRAAIERYSGLSDDWGVGGTSHQSHTRSEGQSQDGQYFWKGRALVIGEQPPSLPKFTAVDTPGSFFRGRAAAREAFIWTQESTRQKAARLDREKNTNTSRYKSGDEVYEWNFDYGTMRWLRTRVSKKEREAVWQIYLPRCKRYDSIAGEWDITEFLDYDALSASMEYQLLDDGEDDRPSDPFFRIEDYGLNPPPPSDEFPPPPPSRIPQGNPPATVTSSDSIVIQRSTTHIPARDTVVEQLVTPIHLPPQGGSADRVHNDQEVPNFVWFLEMLLYFHGFRWGSSEIKPTLKGKRLSLDHACRAVGFYLPDNGTSLLEEEDHRGVKFIAWVSHLVDKKDPPSDWWLLHPDTQPRLKDILTDRGYPLRLSVLRNEVDGMLWWSLHKWDQHLVPWFIIVEDPTVASAAMQKRITWDDVARWMVASGMHHRHLF